MKIIVRNVAVFLMALVLITELNSLFFNLMTIQNWRDSDMLPNFGSFYLEHLAIFLFLSVPEIIAGLALPKLLSGRLNTSWFIAASFFLIIYYHPKIWSVSDMSLLGEVIMYSAYYLHPVSLSLLTIVSRNLHLTHQSARAKTSLL